MAEMTEEQKHAQAELEKTLDTLSEDELDALAGGKVTEDVKKFFQSEKGKEVLKWTAIIGTPVVTIAAAAGIIGGVIRHKKRHLYDDLLDSDHDYGSNEKNPFVGQENPLGTDQTGDDPFADIF